VEPDVYIIASCLPTYRPVLFYLIGRLGLNSMLGYGSTPKDGFSPNNPHSSRSRNFGTSSFASKGANSIGDDIGLVGVTKDKGEIHMETEYSVTPETV